MLFSTSETGLSCRPVPPTGYNTKSQLYIYSAFFTLIILSASIVITSCSAISLVHSFSTYLHRGDPYLSRYLEDPCINVQLHFTFLQLFQLESSSLFPIFPCQASGNDSIPVLSIPTVAKPGIFTILYCIPVYADYCPSYCAKI